jgi:dsRNA-specific ribonuclease
MNEERKKLEAVGDGLLLACARLYLRDRHASVPYLLHMRIISRMVKNSTLNVIAEAEGIRGLKGERLSDAFEVAVALHYYRHGFESARRWLWTLFEKHFDIPAEVKRILDPTPEDALTKSIRGALKMVLGQHGGVITGGSLDKATKQIVEQLRNVLFTLRLEQSIGRFPSK